MIGTLLRSCVSCPLMRPPSLALAPGLRDKVVKSFGNRELRESLGAHGFVGGAQAKLVHLGRHLFESIDFVRGEGVAGGLVPVGAAHGMERETRVLAALRS